MVSRFWVVVVVASIGLSARGGLLAADPLAPDRTEVYKKIRDTGLELHIFTPGGHSASDRRPAIVFFFGGGWKGGSPGQFFPHCAYLASRGMVAMSADYRVESRQGTSPRECVMDGKSAVRWVRANAGRLGIDPARVAAGGGSAGGHVAAATGTGTTMEEDGEDRTTSFVPDALVLFNPVFDNGPGGYGHDRVERYWREISPLHNIGDQAPPTIVFLGTADQLVPVAAAERYQQLMEERGRRCDLHLYPDQAHGFFNYSNRANYVDTVTKVDRFLVSLGFLDGEPTVVADPLPEPEGGSAPGLED